MDITEAIIAVATIGCAVIGNSIENKTRKQNSEFGIFFGFLFGFTISIIVVA